MCHNSRMDRPPLKPVVWVASTKKDLQRLPDPVQDLFGFALYEAQRGGKHDRAKPLSGFGGAGVLEIVDDHDGDTYRAVYTVRFAQRLYVLHVFQKKSRHGISTPPADLRLIQTRLRQAEQEERAQTDQEPQP